MIHFHSYSGAFHEHFMQMNESEPHSRIGHMTSRGKRMMHGSRTVGRACRSDLVRFCIRRAIFHGLIFKNPANTVM